MPVSLTALRAFEAAARHMSFKLAAEELNLSPTAISHQVRGLESALGVRLFDRRVRRVELTAEGEQLVGDIGPAFQAIDRAIGRFRAKSRRATVTLGAGPILASRWLVPRLGRFWQAHPEIDLRLHHSPLPVHQQMARYDIAVAWGDGSWPGTDTKLLLRVETTPVHAPDAALAKRLSNDPARLLDLPLLHYRNREGWRQWLIEAGIALPANLPGAVFDDANVLLQAAIEGQGIALGVLPLVNDEIMTGRLVRPWRRTSVPPAAYYLVRGPHSRDAAPVQAVRDWLLSFACSPTGSDPMTHPRR